MGIKAMECSRLSIMTRDIIRKLTIELETRITTEVQAVYVLAGIRIIIERDMLQNKYPEPNLHCDRALHSESSGNKQVTRSRGVYGA